MKQILIIPISVALLLLVFVIATLSHLSTIWIIILTYWTSIILNIINDLLKSKK